MVFVGRGHNIQRKFLNSSKNEKKFSKFAHQNQLHFGVPIMVQQKQIWLGTMRMQIWFLASLSGLRIWCGSELWYRFQTLLSLALLWLWCRLAAVAPFGLLAWEPPHTVGVILEGTHMHKKLSAFIYTKNKLSGVPIVAQWKKIQLATMRFLCLIPGLAQWVRDLALVWAVV